MGEKKRKKGSADKIREETKRKEREKSRKEID
jgi:hypothetical protein